MLIDIVIALVSGLLFSLLAVVISVVFGRYELAIRIWKASTVLVIVLGIVSLIGRTYAERF